MHKSTGILRYGPDIRAIVEIDRNIGKYYRSLIPKYCFVRVPMYHPHITVVRLKKESPSNLVNWGKYEGELIEFEYSGIIKFDGKYYYLDAYSDRIGKIREELGLSFYRMGFDSYHITIGNAKVDTNLS
jgi:hypothetical protein